MEDRTADVKKILYRAKNEQNTARFFPTLGVAPRLGRNFLATEDEPGRDDVVILGHGVWQSRFAGDRKSWVERYR